MRSPIPAPRAAAWAAAALGLEYAASKAVMAARGELGVVGYPAPPEAYEGFTRDVTAAQLAGVPTGLATVALALALVAPWGRRIPARVRAAAAVLAFAGWLAGASVVVASLAGLREDHGQWGPGALVLALAPPAAWAVLARHALRDARLPRIPRTALPAAGAALGCALYGAMKLDWALGGETLMRQTPLSSEAVRELLAREGAWDTSHWASVGLAVVGVALAVATVRARRAPGALRVWLPGLIGVLMLARAGWGAGSDVAVLTGTMDGRAYAARWDLWLWSPAFALWGTAWLLTARAARADSSVRLTIGSRPARERKETA